MSRSIAWTIRLSFAITNLSGDGMSNNFSRREILAAFLGIPVSLAACRSSIVPSFPAGEIIGASDVLGHKVRDGVRIEPAADAWMRSKLVIVGGGIAGLSAARRLIKAGFDDFVLLELEPAPGGTSRSGSNDAAVV